jgi:hypothetical protein
VAGSDEFEKSPTLRAGCCRPCALAVADPARWLLLDAQGAGTAEFPVVMNKVDALNVYESGHFLTDLACFSLCALLSRSP